jgi:SHS2 domain-containing protein
VYRWAEHTGELELEIEASSERAVFEQAVAALGELLAERAAVDGGGAMARFEVVVSAPDRATLLAEWLTELVYLVEDRGLIPERAERLDLSEGGIDATVSGRLSSPPHLVKAVTYHRLDMREEDETWRARVVLDV